MFRFFLKNKVKFVYLFTILFFVSILFCTNTFGMNYYEKTDFVTGLVTADVLNVRSGPGTNYKVTTQIYKNEYIRVFAKIGNWYVVQTDKDYIGAVSKDYVRAIYPQNEGNNNTLQNTENTNNANSSLTKDEEETFNLINQQRIANGLSPLVIDNEVQNVARIKAKDMVDGGYFSHTSPTYGSPFEMLKKFGITYKSAGENIAGNSSNSGAVNAWMNSEGHKANILNKSYNYTGLAVVSSPKYGKIYVQMFIGK